MKKLSILLAFISLVVLWGCGGDGDKKVDDPDYPDNPTEVNLYLSTSELIFETEGGTKEFNIYCDADWTITYTSDWCEADIKDGQGNRTITLTAIASEEYSDRNFNLTVKAGTTIEIITIIQKKKNALILTKDKYELPDEGGQIKVEVKSNIDYDIMIPSTNLWIKQVQTRSLNTDSLIFNIDQNYNKSQRSGIIIVRNQKENLSDTITVYQEAYETPSLILTQDRYTLPSKDTTIKVELKTNVDYNINIPSEAKAWIQEVSTRAIRTDVIVLKILANENYYDRSAMIKIENKNDSYVYDMLYITQVQKYAIIAGEKEYNLPALGGNIEIDVQSNTEYNIIIPDDSKAWIQQIQTGTLNKSKESFKILPNSVESERTGWIIFKDKKSELSDTITVKQEAKTDCYRGDITLSTVEELKAFKEAGYKKIAGNVLIKSNELRSIQQLENILQEIEGNLTIDAWLLTSLDGLYSLSKIGGDMIFEAYGGITFEGLNNLSSIGGKLKIIWSNNLKSFEGLENLTTIKGDFEMELPFSSHLNALASFKGLNKLNSIGGSFKIISLENAGASLTSLTSFEGLENLTTINGDFEIKDNGSSGFLPALTSFKGLNRLNNIGGNFKLITLQKDGSFLMNFTSFEGLENLTTINGDFEINITTSFSLNDLTSFKGLNKLNSIGGNFKIISSAKRESESSYGWALTSLTSFEGLENLTTIKGDFEINSSAHNYRSVYEYEYAPPSSLNTLASFKGLNKLNSIGGSFKIISLEQYGLSLTSLTSFEGLENLTTINGDLEISNVWGNSKKSLNALASFKGLNGLKSIGGINLSSVESLTSFEGLERLTTVDGDFKISKCYNFSSFKSLNNLATINGYFKISSSDLSSLEGLNSLKTITNYLNINDCDSLNNIDAFKNLTTVKDISITYCPKLYDFCVLKNAVQNNNSTFYTNGNGYNPTKYQLLNGECSKQPE